MCDTYALTCKLLNFVCSTSYRELASIGVNTKVEQQHDPEAILHIAGCDWQDCALTNQVCDR